MAKLIVCRGLPGSGKTTWAEGLVRDEGFVRVNKDDIRRELEAKGWVWSPDNEQQVINTRDARIIAALADGKNVVSDDTNLAKKHLKALMGIAKTCYADFEVRDFDTSVEECIRRDSLREGKAHVGELVIRNMAAQYHKLPPPEIVPVEPNDSLMKAIICDLDGTLSLFDGLRGPYEHHKCASDRLNLPVWKIIRLFHDQKQHQIIYLSGREDKFKPQTLEFLERHSCPPGPILMRSSGDYRKDWIVKMELFDRNVRGNYHVDFVLDDRNQVVEMWRKLGLTCLQVADGAF